jgi:hypothetical protein
MTLVSPWNPARHPEWANDAHTSREKRPAGPCPRSARSESAGGPVLQGPLTFAADR